MIYYNNKTLTLLLINCSLHDRSYLLFPSLKYSVCPSYFTIHSNNLILNSDILLLKFIIPQLVQSYLLMYSLSKIVYLFIIVCLYNILFYTPTALSLSLEGFFNYYHSHFVTSVSYTHLDVYKRQIQFCCYRNYQCAAASIVFIIDGLKGN